MKKIFMILLLISNLIHANLSRNNGVISDSNTNLEWQDTYVNNVKEAIWNDAINYCENLNLNNQNDWRLPNINELSSIVDTNKFSPTINIIFENTNSNYYWTSTTYNYNKQAWVISFTNGIFYNLDKTKNNYPIRCVRTK